MNYCVYGASSDTIHPDYPAGGEELGRCLARHGHGLVFGAGDHGMMGAAARGVAEIRRDRGITGPDPAILGIVPSFFNEEGILYPGCTQLIFTETMRERKQRMEEMSDGFIITPGGLGTFDEFFEIATLRQLGQHGKPVAILNIRGYYDDLERMLRKAVEEHFMGESAYELLHFFESPEELVCWIEKQEPHLVNWRDMKYKEEKK